MMLRSRYALWAALGAIVIGVLSAQAQVPGVNSTLQSVFNLAYDQSTMKPTYSATSVLTPAASATDVCTLAGSATKNIRVRRVIFAGHVSNGTAVTEPVAIIKRSTNGSGGTQGRMTPIPYDTINQLTPTVANAATATAEIFTANPTVGTIVGYLTDVYIPFPAATGLAPRTTFQFGELGSPVVLRGAAQQLAVSLNGITITGLISCTFEWTEE